eukprot:4190093-Lingulodinium_polyedra.AAC.1
MHHPGVSLHSVRGRPIHGLIVDPGASSALMGTETLRGFASDVLDPAGIKVQVEQSDASFIGID